jgi:putative Mn2+ efflux pump MntP
VLALLLVAPLLGLDNFAAAAGMGLAGWQLRTCLKVSVVFGACAAIALGIGLALGTTVAQAVDSSAQSLGGAILVLVGLVRLVSLLKRPAPPGRAPLDLSLRSLLLIGVGVSLDSVAGGVGLGLFGVPIVAAVAIITAVTMLMTLAGFRLASLVAGQPGDRGQQYAAVALLLVGIGLIAHIL